MEFLLYIKFEQVFALVGGLRTISVTINREVVQTEDFEKPYKILIPGSGVKALELSGNGVMDFPQGKEMLQKLWNFYNNATLFQARLDSEGLTRIAGGFILTEFEINSQANMENQFTFTLESSGEFAMEALNAP